MIPEQRTRVTFFLPLNDKDEHRAVLDIQRYLKCLRATKAMAPVTGFTHGILGEPAFRGQWWDESKTIWAPDKIVLFITDLLGARDDDAVLSTVRLLREHIAGAYEKVGRPQASLWIVIQSANIYT